MVSKPAECQGCPYYDRPGPVWSDPGKEEAKIAIIGESPGWDELREGKGFVGRAGHELWALAGAVGITRDMCFVGNVVKCMPHGADEGSYKLDPKAIDHCRRAFLDKELSKCQATVEVLVGGTVLQTLMGLESITRYRGVVLTRKRP